MSDVKIVVATHAKRPIRADHVVSLYSEAEWWPERTSPQVAGALESGPAVGAWAEDRLVGFTRAVSDGHFRAYVEDTVVSADMRGKGVGKQLTAALLKELEQIPNVSLCCDKKQAAYFKSKGFAPSEETVLHRDK